MLITSVNNSKIKELTKLHQTKYRKLTNTFLVEEKHLIEEASRAGIIIELILLDGTDCDYNYPNFVVSAEVMKKLSTNISLNSMIAVCKCLENSNIFSDQIIILDRIQDPGNIGSIMRSAYSFGYNTVILSCDCVDIYNSKALKASQGAFFHMNVIIGDLQPLLLKIKENGYYIIATDLKSDNSIETINTFNKYALIFGNEGNGISENILKLADITCKIELNNDFDSLNVLVAASICMYILKK